MSCRRHVASISRRVCGMNSVASRWPPSRQRVPVPRNDTLHLLSCELALALSLLVAAARTPEDLAELATQLGWELPPGGLDLLEVASATRSLIESATALISSSRAAGVDPLVSAQLSADTLAAVTELG